MGHDIESVGRCERHLEHRPTPIYAFFHSCTIHTNEIGDMRRFSWLQMRDGCPAIVNVAPAFISNAKSSKVGRDHRSLPAFHARTLAALESRQRTGRSRVEIFLLVWFDFALGRDRGHRPGKAHLHIQCNQVGQLRRMLFATTASPDEHQSR